MKTVTQIKKMKSTVEVTFDDVNVMAVEPELMIKYHLSLGKQLDNDVYQVLSDENLYLSCLRTGLKALKKMLTIFEMKNLLLAKGYHDHIINKVIKNLLEKKYLDDFQYAKMYVSLKQYQEGPQMIQFKLTQKGVHESHIFNALGSYQEFEIVSHIVASKFNQMKKKTKKQATQTIKSQLMAKGFHSEIIDAALLKSDQFYQSDEKKLLEIAYEKLFKTYHTKYSGYELEYKIKEKLYQKGFSYEDIKTYIEQKKLHSW